jgi:hypothetical protein
LLLPQRRPPTATNQITKDQINHKNQTDKTVKSLSDTTQITELQIQPQRQTASFITPPKKKILGNREKSQKHIRTTLTKISKALQNL